MGSYGFNLNVYIYIYIHFMTILYHYKEKEKNLLNMKVFRNNIISSNIKDVHIKTFTIIFKVFSNHTIALCDKQTEISKLLFTENLLVVLTVMDHCVSELTLRTGSV